MKRLIRKKGIEKILVHVKALSDEKETDKQQADTQQKKIDNAKDGVDQAGNS